MNYDLHIHTKYSSCSNIEPSLLLKTAAAKSLNGIAITDHNSIKGALVVKKLNKNKDFEVIVGEEIQTDKGEVLAYYLSKEIKPGCFDKVIEQVHDQNALAVIAHPFTFGIFRKRAKVDFNVVKKIIDGMEIFNARNLFNRANRQAQHVAEKIGIAGTAGSDAHFLFEIGRAKTIFDSSLRDALKKRKTKINGSNSLAFFGLSFSTFQKYLFRNFF